LAKAPPSNSKSKPAPKKSETQEKSAEEREREREAIANKARVDELKRELAAEKAKNKKIETLEAERARMTSKRAAETFDQNDEASIPQHIMDMALKKARKEVEDANLERFREEEAAKRRPNAHSGANLFQTGNLRKDSSTHFPRSDPPNAQGRGNNAYRGRGRSALTPPPPFAARTSPGLSHTGRSHHPRGQLWSTPHGPILHCNQQFSTDAALQAHKSSTGHKRKPSQKSKSGTDVPPAAGSNKRKSAETLDHERSPSKKAKTASDVPPASEKRKRSETTDLPLQSPPLIESAPSPPGLSRNGSSVEPSNFERPVQRKRPRTETLKETFLGLVGAIESKINSGRCEKRAGIDEIVKLIRSKGFVRSDSIEKEAVRLSRSNNIDSAFQSLLDLIKNIEWS